LTNTVIRAILPLLLEVLNDSQWNFWHLWIATDVTAHIDTIWSFIAPFSCAPSQRSARRSKKSKLFADERKERFGLVRQALIERSTMLSLMKTLESVDLLSAKHSAIGS